MEIKMFKHKKKNAFTLIELVITLAIVALITGAAVSAFVFGPKSFGTQVNWLSNQYRVRDLTRSISKEVRTVDKVDIKVKATSLKIGENTYSFSNETVYRNGKVFSTEIMEFTYSLDDDLFTLTASSTDKRGKPVSMTVEIYIR